MKQIKPINDINHNEINLPKRVADIAIFIFMFCANKIAIELASVVPIPPGVNDIAPNKPDVSCDNIAS